MVRLRALHYREELLSYQYVPPTTKIAMRGFPNSIPAVCFRPTHTFFLRKSILFFIHAACIRPELHESLQAPDLHGFATRTNAQSRTDQQTWYYSAEEFDISRLGSNVRQPIALGSSGEPLW